MPRRVSLPGASELFRATQNPEPAQDLEPAATDAGTPAAAPQRTSRARAASAARTAGADTLPMETTAEVEPSASDVVEAAPVSRTPRARRAPVAPLSRPSASGRVRHDEKITVYVSSDELLALEEARISLRRAGIAVDRGRLVRAAIALAMADLAEHGDEGALVDHLLGS